MATVALVRSKYATNGAAPDGTLRIDAQISLLSMWNRPLTDAESVEFRNGDLGLPVTPGATPFA